MIIGAAGTAMALVPIHSTITGTITGTMGMIIREEATGMASVRTPGRAPAARYSAR
jgi:hypothetical protein